jgi:hypothetical protein
MAPQKHQATLLGRLFRRRAERGPRRLAFEGEAFQLHLDGDWLEAPDTDPERFNFTSSEKRTAIVISAMPVRLPRDRLLEAAERLAEARRAAEQAVPGRTVTFGDNCVELKEDGELGHVAYAGYDNHGSIFRFMWVGDGGEGAQLVGVDRSDRQRAFQTGLR